MHFFPSFSYDVKIVSVFHGQRATVFHFPEKLLYHQRNSLICCSVIGSFSCCSIFSIVQNLKNKIISAPIFIFTFLSSGLVDFHNILKIMNTYKKTNLHG
jgi:hypothetical protein